MDISIFSILTISFFHWIFDFIFQSHWMASNKSKNNKALAAHVGVYTIGMLIAGLILLPPSINVIYFAFLNGILHFCVDWVTSRCTSKLYAKGDFHNFFVVIGLDQFIHLVSMALTYYYFA